MILLENLHVILEKTPRDDIRKEVLPLLYTAFDFSDIEVQVRIVFNHYKYEYLHYVEDFECRKWCSIVAFSCLSTRSEDMVPDTKCNQIDGRLFFVYSFPSDFEKLTNMTNTTFMAYRFLNIFFVFTQKITFIGMLIPPFSRDGIILKTF